MAVIGAGRFGVERPPVTLRLVPDMFGAVRRELLVRGDLRVTLFRYESGIEGLRIEHGVGHVDVLPFVGQQLWRAEFHGRPLAMTSTFEEPVVTTDYLSNNGAYFVHCGGSAMGNPGVSDEHPLHGELPNARYSGVVLVVGDDRITVRGGVTHRVSFGSYFSAVTSVTVTEGSGVLESRVELTNLSGEARQLMYLAHINFRPAVGGTIADRLVPGRRPVTRADFELGTDRVPVDAAQLDDGTVPFDRLLEAGMRVEPEVVQSVPAAADADGWVTTRQHHPDGTADVVAHRSADLTHTLRWLRRSADDQAFGFALPATAEADGLAAETGKGNVRHYGPGETLVAHIRHGIEPVQGSIPTERNIR